MPYLKNESYYGSRKVIVKPINFLHDLFSKTALWRHRKALHKLQDKEGLSASHKLSKAHIDYYQQLR